MEHKYSAIQTDVDGIVFPSKHEAKRYSELKLLERCKVISGLTLQPKFSLDVNGVHIGKYTGDFEYVENGKRVVEDAKGFKTRDYPLRKKLMLAIHGIEIQEV